MLLQFKFSETASLGSPGLSFTYAILMTCKNCIYYIFITGAMTEAYWLNFFPIQQITKIIGFLELYSGRLETAFFSQSEHKSNL